MSKAAKKLSNCLKRAETSVVLIRRFWLCPLWSPRL